MSFKRLISVSPYCFDEISSTNDFFTEDNTLAINGGTSGTVYLPEQTKQCFIAGSLYGRDETDRTDIFLHLMSDSQDICVRVSGFQKAWFCGKSSTEEKDALSNSISVVNDFHFSLSVSDKEATFTVNETGATASVKSTNSLLNGEPIKKFLVFNNNSYLNTIRTYIRYVTVSDEPIDPRAQVVSINPTCTGDWVKNEESGLYQTSKAAQIERIGFPLDDKNLVGYDVVSRQAVIEKAIGGGDVKSITFDDKQVNLSYIGTGTSSNATTDEYHTVESKA